MEIISFVDRCIGEGLEWSDGEYGKVDGIFVKDPYRGVHSHFSKDVIEENDWETLKIRIYQGKDIYHVTRIVGYFSRIENWNKSKLGELKDRQKGSYIL